MLINVKVTTKAKENKIIKCNKHWKAYLTDVPEKGKANKKLIKILSEYFGVSKSQINIFKGEKIKDKIIKIMER